MVRRIASACAILLLPVALPAPTHGAEITDVLDAFDYENDNPFDFNIEPGFRQQIERGRITREAGCSSTEEPDRCPDGDVTLFNRELDYRRVTNFVDIDVRLGLYRDLEFYVGIPIVVSDRRALEYADDVSGLNTTVNPDRGRVLADLDPSTSDIYGDYFGTYTLFNVPDDGIRRSGMGDMALGLRWSPFNDSRNKHAANLTVGFEYVAPTGKPARRTNRGAGRGVHEVAFSIAASRRFTTYLDPYFGLSFRLPIAASSGLFEAHPNSSTTAPGASFLTTAGTELVMAEDEDRGTYYSFDLGVDFGYTFEGRDYSPLFDALGQSRCNNLTPAQAGYGSGGPDGNAYRPGPELDPNDVGCAWVVQQPGNAQTTRGQTPGSTPYVHDGITDVEGYASIGGHTGFNLQFSPYVKFQFATFLRYQTPHYITAASAGRDADGDGVVNLDPDPDAPAVAERNPNYNLALDSVGSRFRFENSLLIGWKINLAFQF